MKKVIALMAVAAFTLTGVAIAAELKSGLQVGASVGAFNVKDCSGPNEGKTLCYRCQYGQRPVVAVFTRRLSDDLTGLVKKIDETVAKNSDKKMAAFVVYLSDEPDSVESKLKGIAKTLNIAKTPLTTFETNEGPDGYKISRDADVTVMMWHNGKVASSRGFAKDKITDKDVEKIISDANGLVK
ncbi:MAG: hypothetical protein FJ295_01350 [Planctomycetes bacterium]|nr:hypothetical protein [Planctomycetota bacterium]